MRKHIPLKASTFHSSKSINKLSKDSNLFTFFYYEAQIKSKGFSLLEEKMKETSYNNQISSFLKKSRLAEHQYLTILNFEFKHA